MEKGLDVVNKGVFNVDSCGLELEGYLRNTHTKWIKYESSHDKHRMNLYLQKGGSFQVLMLRTITILFSTKSYLLCFILVSHSTFSFLYFCWAIIFKIMTVNPATLPLFLQ